MLKDISCNANKREKGKMTAKNVGKLERPTNAQLEWRDLGLEMLVCLDPVASGKRKILR